MPFTEQEKILRLIARRRIETGDLPCEMPATVWGGPGSGEQCSLCGAPITSQEIEFEYAYQARDFRFHRLCHGLWQLECERAQVLNQALKGNRSSTQSGYP